MKTDYQARIKLVRRDLAEINSGGLVVSQPENRYYLSGFSGSTGYLFITGTDCILATDFRYLEQAAKESPDYHIYRTEGPFTNWFPVLISELNITSLSVESCSVTLSEYNHMEKALQDSGVHIVISPVENLIEDFRAVKDEGELDAIHSAARLADRALTYGVENYLKPGISEKALAWELEKYIREHGGELAFPIIIACGPSSAMPHAQPSDRLLQKNEPIIIDLGVKRDHYCSDLTRTFWLGKPDKKFTHLYDLVLRAQQSAISEITSGTPGAIADEFARKVIAQAGYGDAFGHSLGHGVGMAVHELPRLGQNSVDVLRDGAVFSIEPGIYLSGWGGIRIEDLAYLKNGRTSLLSNASK